MVRLVLLCFALANSANLGSEGNHTNTAFPANQNSPSKLLDSSGPSGASGASVKALNATTASGTNNRQHESTIYKHSLGRLRSWPWPRSSVEITLPKAALEKPASRPGNRSGRGKLLFGSQLNQSLEDTSPLLNAFAEFRLPEEDFRNLRVSSFVDWNGDGVQDVLAMDVGFFDYPNDKNRSGPLMSVYCMNKKVMAYNKCFSQRLDVVSAIKKHTKLGDDLEEVHVYVSSLVASDFQRNNVLSLLLILRGNADMSSQQVKTGEIKNKVFSLGSQEFSFLHFVRDGTADDSSLHTVWMTDSGEGSSIPPIVVDLDWDGYLDLLGNEANRPSRMIWINQRNGTFKAFPWRSQPGLFDFQNYSSTPKVDFSHESFLDQRGPLQENHTPSSRLLSDHHDNDIGFFAKIGKAFQSAWFRLGLSRDNHRDETKVDEESLLSRHSSDRLPFEMPRQVQWVPRPLPLVDSTPIASIMGHALVDMNGDCIADLALVVESPDFEGRYELEIWLLEEDISNGLDRVSQSTGNISRDSMPFPSVKWRMWRGQRILLPDGALAVALDDFSSRGNVDLLILACDQDDEINEVSVLQEKFANRKTDGPEGSDVIPFCRGLERLVLHKMFQPPLCVSKKLMPDPLATTCRETNDLCSGSAFGFGGVDDGMRRTGFSISTLEMEETDLENHPRTTLGAALPYAPPIITVQDIDKDGFLDILLLTVPRNREQEPSGGQLRILKNVNSAVFPDQSDPSNLDGEAYSPYDYMQDPYEGWWQHALSLLSVCFTSISSISKNVYSKLFDPTKILDDPFSARRFKAIHDITTPYASLYSGGFIEDPLVTGTVSILTFSDFPHNLSSVHLFSPIAGNSFATSPLGAPAEENFFLSVTVLSEVDESCLVQEKNAVHSSPQPILGGVAAMTVSDYEGVKYPVRRVMSQISTRTQLVSRFLYFGLGRSSNYIEGIQLGTPFVTEYPPKCGSNASDASHSGVFHKSLSSFNRRWVALIPNSDISVIPGVPRWNIKAWNLMLCVNPGQQASRILLGTALALLVVGCINMLLSRREKAIMNREQRGFRRRLLGI